MLREYQQKISTEASEILQRKGFVYLSMTVRTGKTLTALETAKKFGAKKCLFITKLKAFSSIENDYFNFGYIPFFDLKIINKESIHKIPDNDFDLIICDEAHALFSTYPKPNQFTKDYVKRFYEVPSILLSGTMSPESFSQLFHQFWINKFAPFRNYKNFYEWAKKYVNIKQKRLGYAVVNDYSDADRSKFYGMIKHHIITYTQEQAGFKSKVNEIILECEMKPIVNEIIKRLTKDNFVRSKSGKIIMADTAVKLQQKIHQISSGTVKFEDGTHLILDDSKVMFIKDYFKDKKIAIFYNFKSEFEMLKKHFDLADTLEDFNDSGKNIAFQFVSGREGINLSKADCLVMFNIQFSAVSYLQSIDRMTTIDRLNNDVYWVFSKGGIEHKIYERVKNKLDYTNAIFKKDYGLSEKNNTKIQKRRLSCY